MSKGEENNKDLEVYIFNNDSQKSRVEVEISKDSICLKTFEGQDLISDRNQVRCKKEKRIKEAQRDPRKELALKANAQARMIAADLCEEAFGKKGPENEFRSIAEIALENWHFALELFLKYIILTENETYEETGISHDIDYLIDKVSDKTLIPESELYDDWDIIKTDGWRPSKRYLPARKISSIKKYCDSYRRICKWIQEKLNK